MPVHTKRLTDTVARGIAPPAEGYALHWCPNTLGFGLRVTAAGARAWIAERRVEGKTVRRTLGKANGRAAITAEAARRLQVDVSSELQQGTDRLEIKRERIKAERVEALTFGDALRSYVKTKIRKTDKLPLKARTVSDYLAMLDGPKQIKQSLADKEAGKAPKQSQGGELHSIANTALPRLTAEMISSLHASLKSRGERRQTYAMQVLRAVLRHKGATIEGNPLSPATAGEDRVHFAPSRGKPSPIPDDRLGAWWRAACSLDTDSARELRFMLLTGCRPGEAAGLAVRDIDVAGCSANLIDTKNRSDHLLLLSTQAMEIVAIGIDTKKPAAKVFGVGDPGKTLAAINAAAGTPGVTAHKLRHTFASIADDLVSAATARAMLNHAEGNVTQKHYIGLSATKLRAGWQAVADFIEAAP